MALNILVVKYSSLGDIINAVPAVKLLRAGMPDARIHWLINKAYAPLIEDVPFVDEVIIAEGRGLGPTLRAISVLRRRRIDLVVDLQGLLKSAVIGYFSGASRRVSFPYTREGSGVFYSEKLGESRRDGVHAVVENASVVAGILGRDLPTDLSTELPVGESVINEARKLIKDVKGSGPLLALSPTSRWDSKMWGVASFAALADIFIEKNDARVVFTGTADDRGYIKGIIKKMRNKAINLAGKTDIKQLAAVFKLADIYVGCDSGATHIAASQGTAVVAVFGPTDPAYTGPYGDNAEVVSMKASCSPCRKRECKDLRCMHRVSANMVYDAAMRRLNS
ncbi:Lipopolysaccharide core heptosyltransferase I [hydrothermal vent metagenome]|uniref:Lipopolysaccharide core heptosyltransferase I n=1 Tax=hydrothermal vent metagenome TaxID=652676 RepID=A0A3B0QT66_9ZZZZ